MATETITAQQEAKRDTLQGALAEVRQRLLDIGAEQDTLTMQKGQLALNYAVGETTIAWRHDTNFLLERRTNPSRIARISPGSGIDAHRSLVRARNAQRAQSILQRHARGQAARSRRSDRGEWPGPKHGEEAPRRMHRDHGQRRRGATRIPRHYAGRPDGRRARSGD